MVQHGLHLPASQPQREQLVEQAVGGRNYPSCCHPTHLRHTHTHTHTHTRKRERLSERCKTTEHAIHTHTHTHCLHMYYPSQEWAAGSCAEAQLDSKSVCCASIKTMRDTHPALRRRVRVGSEHFTADGTWKSRRLSMHEYTFHRDDTQSERERE